MFKEKLLKFLKANGIEEAPEVSKSEYTMVEGFVPSEHWVWFKSGFLKLSLALGIVPENEAGALGVLEELQKFFGVQVEVKVAWDDLDKPVMQNVPFKNPIGAKVPAEMVQASSLMQGKEYFFNAGDKFPEIGSKFSTPEGTFTAVAFGMFSRWWMKT